MIGVVLAAAVYHAFSASAEAAALQAVGFAARPKIVRINRAGRFATVLTGNGIMEGSAVRQPVLVERFTRGWQPLSLIYSQCNVREMQAIAGAANAARLMAGMPAPVQDPGKCDPPVLDSGSHADILAIRSQMRGPLVPYVLVSRNWALAEWYGAGGGSALFHRSNEHWHLFRSGGGAMDVAILRAFGVPLADVCRFRPGLAVRAEDARTCRSQ